MTEQSEIRQSIDYLVTRIARDYQKEEFKDNLKVQIPFRAEGLKYFWLMITSLRMKKSFLRMASIRW